MPAAPTQALALLLTSSLDALVPLARAGELDAKLVRVLRYRQVVGAPSR